MTSNSTTKSVLAALLGLGVALSGCASPDEATTPGGDETIGGDTAGDGNLPGPQQDAGDADPLGPSEDTTDSPPLGDGRIGSTQCEAVDTAGSTENESLFTNDTGTVNDSMFQSNVTTDAGEAPPVPDTSICPPGSEPSGTANTQGSTGTDEATGTTGASG